MRIEDMLIVSDLDGTLIPASGGISRKNLNAIAEFREKGGTFTVATGRSPISAKRFLSLLQVNTSIISNNGALVYDMKKNAPAWFRPLDPSFRKIVREVRDDYPQVAIEVISAQDIYFLISANEELNQIQTVQGCVYQETTPEELPDDCCKVLFVINKREFQIISREILGRGYPYMEFVASGGDCFEMMAEGINKGYPLGELAKAHGKTLENTIAVGDYYNDQEMIAGAAFGVAMGNAPDSVKAFANLVVSSCEEDGVAELIAYLIANHNRLDSTASAKSHQV